MASNGRNSACKVGHRLRQNAQHAARSVSPVIMFIGSHMNHSPGANHYSLEIAVGPSAGRRGARGPITTDRHSRVQHGRASAPVTKHGEVLLWVGFSTGSTKKLPTPDGGLRNSG